MSVLTLRGGTSEIQSKHVTHVTLLLRSSSGFLQKATGAS